MSTRWLAVLCTVVTVLASWPTAALAGPAPASTLASAPRMQSAPPGTARTAGAAEAPAGTVAVIPFTNISGNEADEWIGAGIAETVMADLESQAAFTVIVPARVPASGDRGTELDETAVLALGRDLGAQWVVTGGYQRLGDQLRITARIADTATGVVARTLIADGVLDEIFALQDRIATELTAEAATTVAAVSAPRMPASSRRPAGGRGAGTAPADAPPASEADAGVSASGAVSGGLVLPGSDRTERQGGQRAARGNGGAGGVGTSPAAAAPGTAPAAAVPVGILAGRPSVSAARADEEPNIDGQLDDAIWQRATRITEFIQMSPIEGAPPSEDTEVYIAYDDDNLYIGLYAHYSDPGTVRANRVDRDRAGFGDDTISIYFDPFLDQQRAYVFTLNGYGVQGDSLLNARGGGGGRGGGGRGGRSGGGGFSGGRGGFGGVPRGDSSWDVLFESGGTLVADGWTAEMAIPFKSLRYPAVGDQAHRWGFQIARQIREKDETVVWSPISRDISGFLPQMGLLEGLSGLSTSRNLEILPTVTAVQVGNLDTTNGKFPTESVPEGGVNLKYGLTSNLTLDATYNPDFSQIESDRPQIEVNQRFPLFYSEQRPFFLEGQEIFSLPGPVNFVHTRTIVDPRYGGKISGKVGKTTVGLLVANDEAPGNLDDEDDDLFGKTANVLIGRVRYDLYSESHIGAIVTDREFLDSYSRLGGLDGNFRLSDTASIGFRAITTSNRDEFLPALEQDTSGNMFDVGLRSQGRNLSYFVAGYTIDPEFDTKVGFVRRRDLKALTSQVGYNWWPESWLINWGPQAGYGRNYDFNDVLVDETRQIGVLFSFAKNIRFGTSVNRDMERFGGINFEKTSYMTNLFISTFEAASIGGFYRFGDEVRYLYDRPSFLGTGSNGSIFMTLRPSSRLQSQINISTSRLIDPDENELFNVKIFRALTTLQFTDRLLLRNIVEYNTFSRTVGANVLFTYRVNSGTVFFIGYDDNYQQGDLILDSERNLAYVGNRELLTTDLLRTNRAFFTKISYLFRY